MANAIVTTSAKSIVAALPLVFAIRAIVSGWWRMPLQGVAMPFFWPWVVAGLVVAVLSTLPVVADRYRWWRYATVVMVANVVASCAAMLFAARDPANNVLWRDIVGLTVASGVVTLASWGSARLLHWCFREPAINAAYALLILALFLGFSPGIWLVIHCSSGDCL